MAADPFDKLRLKLMQDVLPVGVAVVERARRGGLKDLVSAFGADQPQGDPLSRLRDEGEPIASQLRNSLDRLSPGLGNPVMKVDVRVEPDASADAGALVVRLAALEQRLGQLEALLEQQP
jgi:hypothetical protein